MRKFNYSLSWPFKVAFLSLIIAITGILQPAIMLLGLTATIFFIFIQRRKFNYSLSWPLKAAYLSLIIAIIGILQPAIMLLGLTATIFFICLHYVTMKKIGNIGLGMPSLGKRVSINQITRFGKKGKCPYIDFFSSLKEFKKTASREYVYYTYTHKTILDQIEKNFDVIKIEEGKIGSLDVEKFLLGFSCRKCRKNGKCYLQDNGRGSRMFYCVEFKVKSVE